MGPVENALRNIAPDCLRPGGDRALYDWLWHFELVSESRLGIEVIRCVSWAASNIGLNDGHGVTEAYDDGLLPELMSEAIEAAEALGL